MLEDGESASPLLEDNKETDQADNQSVSSKKKPGRKKGVKMSLTEEQLAYPVMDVMSKEEYDDIVDASYETPYLIHLSVNSDGSPSIFAKINNDLYQYNARKKPILWEKKQDGEWQSAWACKRRVTHKCKCALKLRSKVEPDLSADSFWNKDSYRILPIANFHSLECNTANKLCTFLIMLKMNAYFFDQRAYRTEPVVPTAKSLVAGVQKKVKAQEMPELFSQKVQNNHSRHCRRVLDAHADERRGEDPWDPTLNFLDTERWYCNPSNDERFNSPFWEKNKGFSAELDIGRMKQERIWYCDGCHGISKGLGFQQVYCISTSLVDPVSKKATPIPRMYILLSGKSKDIFSEMLSELIKLTDGAPNLKCIRSDFEPGLIPDLGSYNFISEKYSLGQLKLN